MRAWRWSRFFRCLPEPGGIADQNPALIELVLAAEDWYEKRIASQQAGLSASALAALLGGRRAR